MQFLRFTCVRYIYDKYNILIYVLKKRLGLTSIWRTKCVDSVKIGVTAMKASFPDFVFKGFWNPNQQDLEWSTTKRKADEKVALAQISYVIKNFAYHWAKKQVVH